MTRRRLPRPSAFSDLLKLKRPELNPTKRRLAAAQTIYDLRDIAKRVTPRALRSTTPTVPPRPSCH